MHDIDRTQIGRETETFEYSGAGSVFNEQQEAELAGELLEIGSEAEFDHFLGDLISKAGKAVGSFISSPTGQALGGFLKNAAGKLLPAAGRAVGGYFGGSTGANIGGQLASQAGKLFGLGEAEAEEAEYEAAANFVRLAADAVKHAAMAPPGNPRAIAHAAVMKAAEVHAPGLLAAGGPAGPGSESVMGRGRAGRWIRRGSKIVLFGV